MIIEKCKQRTPTWCKARAGIPTASGFCRIVTPDGKLRKGKTPQTYLAELVNERLNPDAANGNGFQTWSMERGIALEPHARAWYSLASGRRVSEVGFVFGDERKLWGCSPDGLFDMGAGVLEIKCPSDASIIAQTINGIDEDYALQAQGQMWVCGAQYADIVLYTEIDEQPVGHVVRIEADIDLHMAFRVAVPEFAARVIDAADSIRQRRAAYKHVTMEQVADMLGPAWARFEDNRALCGELTVGTGGAE